MQVNTANLEAMYYSFDARFQAAFGRTAPWSAAIATEVPSTTKANRYPWMDLLPRMREWVGERVVRNLSARAFAIENKAWELTLEVDKEDVEDDNLGLYSQRAEMMGQQARKWPDDVITDLLQAAGSTIGPDGQYYFDTDHPVSLDRPALGTYSNSLALALTAANYGIARSSMGSLLGADQRSLNVTPNVLAVPPALEDTARAILNAEMIAPSAAWAGNAAGIATTNIYRNSAQLLVVPEWNNDPTRWYLFDTTKGVKPFIFQMRKTPEFVSLINLTDPNVFWRKKFVYGVDSRGNAGFSLPFLALTSKP